MEIASVFLGSDVGCLDIDEMERRGSSRPVATGSYRMLYPGADEE